MTCPSLHGLYNMPNMPTVPRSDTLSLSTHSLLTPPPFTGPPDPGFGDKFVNTSYGTSHGEGNVPTGAERQRGTGYDQHGNVVTSFGRWPIEFDPVTGTARVVTSRVEAGALDPLAGGAVPPGGLVDISISAAGHATMGQDEGEGARGGVHKEQPKEEQRGAEGGRA